MIELTPGELLSTPRRAAAIAGSRRSSSSRTPTEILGIPFGEAMRVALASVAHTLGTDVRPGPRRSRDEVVRWETR